LAVPQDGRDGKRPRRRRRRRKRRRRRIEWCYTHIRLIGIQNIWGIVRGSIQSSTSPLFWRECVPRLAFRISPSHLHLIP
jgi:hypothetical protein